MSTPRPAVPPSRRLFGPGRQPDGRPVYADRHGARPLPPPAPAPKTRLEVPPDVADTIMLAVSVLGSVALFVAKLRGWL